ncbi:MAG: glycoside hydrolase family 15 protein [Dehalococcoidia bacterium]
MMSEAERPDRYPPIGSYALIGDCQTAALVSNEGSVDWYCPARFDGEAVFCRLLDAAKGGYFRLAPTGRFSARRRYLGSTVVLETTFEAPGGRARLTDLMPVHRRAPTRSGHDVGASFRLMRLVEGLDGEPELELLFKPTFDYARRQAEISIVAGQGVVARSGGEFLALACEGIDLAPVEDGLLRGTMKLGRGERRWVVLTYAHDPDHAYEALAPVRPDDQLRRTLDYWQAWAGACTYRGPYRDAVLRGALTLKALIYEPTGAVVAAPTSSLPEEVGGVRNWDYRYTWLRDSALSLYALMTIGYYEEAEDFFVWLDRACGDDPTRAPQVIYTIDGGRTLPEVELHHLEGYRGSRPVRLGNAAAGQQQLDVFGEILSSAYLYYRQSGRGRGRETEAHGRGGRRPTAQTWALLRRLVDEAAVRWDQPGHGIWEVRGDRQHYLYGKLMAWAALDRGVRLAREHGLEAPTEQWTRTRDAIREAILNRGYSQRLGAFTQAFGVEALDASALAIPRIGFLPATDPRVQSTIDRIRQDLTHDGLVYRYRNPDGLPGSEAAFAMCSFWLVDALALAGRLDEARELFDRLLLYANDVGLLSEEIDAERHELLGNFPQGFTHLALIGAAVNLAKAMKHGAEDRSENEAERADRAGPAAAEGDSSCRDRSLSARS